MRRKLSAEEQQILSVMKPGKKYQPWQLSKYTNMDVSSSDMGVLYVKGHVNHYLQHGKLLYSIKRKK